MIRRIDKLLTAIEERVLQTLFIAMALVTLVQVFNRVLFNYPMPWGDELARYLFVWVIYLASSYAVRANAHIGVTALIERFPEKPRWIAEMITDLICFLFCCALFVFALQIINTQILMGQRSPSMRLPMQYAYLGLAVGGFFMAVRFLLRAIFDFTARDIQKAEDAAL